jgi:ATP phosphoribosyltransferase
LNKNKTRHLIFITSKINPSTLLILPKNSGLEKYRAELEKLPNKKVIVRAEDVAFFIELMKEQGKDCVGLTGEDLFLEYKLNNTNTNVKVIQKVLWSDSTAMFGKPTLCLLGKKGKNLANSTIAINKKYTSLAEQYFLQNTNPKNKIYFSGSTEIAVEINIADFVMDIVYSGKSARQADLLVFDKLIESDVVVLA